MRDMIFDSLAELLTSYGFKLAGGDVLHREIHPLQHSIWCSQHISEPDRRRVNLGLAVFDPFLEVPDYVLAVTMNLRPDGVFHREVESSWWGQHESESVVNSMSDFGIRWFAERGTLPVQEGVFESSISKNLLVSDLNLSLPPQKHKNEKRVENVPAAYLYSASLLHFHNGNRSLACLRTKEYAERVRRIKIPGEPERTFRQLQALGCSL